MRIVSSLASLALIAIVAGCGSTGPSVNPAIPTTSAASASGASTGAPAAATSASSEIEQLLAQAVQAPIDLSAPGPRLDQAEQAMTDFLRQAGGVAELLGPDGATTLTKIDAAEKDAIAAMVAEMRAQGAVPRADDLAIDVAHPQSAPLAAQLASVDSGPPGASEPNPQVVGESLFGAFMFTMMAPELYARAPRNASGNLDRQTMTQEMTTSDGSTIRLTLIPSLAGSKLNAEVKVTISVPGPPAYTEQATGTLTVDLCPDAGGNVPLQLTLGGGFSILGGGMQYHVAVTATGHTDDSGKLASIDVQAEGSLASQPLTGQGALGTAPMYVELRAGYSAGMGAGAAVSNATGSAPRYSSQVDAAFVRSAIAMTAGMGSTATVLGFQSAEKLWTTGYCLEIAVPSVGTGGSQTVATGSTTPFTANVRHKFEGTELVVPVTATLGSGGVSVSPSGSPVTAPANFQYKAPDQDRQTAIVDLETHSKRGIATLGVTFTTGASAYTVDGTYFGVYHLTGTICDLTNAFKLNGNAARIVAKGVFSFEPAGADGGTWKYTGKMGPAGGALAYKGSGAYTVVRPAGGTTDAVPVLRMAGGTDWTITAPIVGTMPLGENVHLGPGDDVKLVPAPQCPG